VNEKTGDGAKMLLSPTIRRTAFAFGLRTLLSGTGAQPLAAKESDRSMIDPGAYRAVAENNARNNLPIKT
jgi:hypothetical protein